MCEKCHHCAHLGLKMSGMSFLLFMMSLILCFVSQVFALVDFCDADPRSRIILSTCHNDRPRLLLHVRNLHSNPFHSLHDTMWPVGHYLAHCVRYFSYGDVDIMTHTADLFNFAACLSDKSGKGPLWGLCALQSMAERVGGEVLGVTDSGKVMGGGCYDKIVTFGLEDKELGYFGGLRIRVDYRDMQWFGRVCAEGADGDCDGGVNNHSMLVPLTTEMKREALFYLRDSVMRMVGVRFEKDDGNRNVRVLLYDRGDTKRRQWASENSGTIYRIMERDDRVEVRFLHRMPASLKWQVKVHAWADVLLAPHGGGMANTVFLKEGSEVIEANKRCDEWIERKRYVPGEWTGWHAPYMGINVMKLQCRREEGELKERKDSLVRQGGPEVNGSHKYRVEEVLELMETVLERQVIRFKRIRDAATEKKSRAAPKRMEQLRIFMMKFNAPVEVGWGRKWVVVVASPLVLSMVVVMLRRVGKRRHFELRTNLFTFM